MTGSLVRVQDLRLCAGDVPVLDGVNLAMGEGETLGVIGPSGSGKTTLALAVLGHLREGIRHAGGQVLVDGAPVLPDAPPWLRGRTVGYVGQDPGSALNPYARIGSILLTANGSTLPRRARAGRVAALLERVGLPADAGFAHRYPHQLSGGQQQRVVLAAALARDPRLLVLDEPTTALDLLARSEVLAELRRLRAAGMTILWISHDLDLVRTLADRIVTVDTGRISDGMPARSTPLASMEPVSAPAAAPVLCVAGLTAGYGQHAVLRDVDFTVTPGECVAVLGVSGVGKTTLARCLTGLHRPSHGTLWLRDTAIAWDVRARTDEQRAAVQLVAQNPAEALHPRQDVHTAVTRPLRRLHGMRRGPALEAEVRRLLDAVRLPATITRRLPSELSGGQRQRVALARALAARPTVLLCDEVTAALDLDTEAEILSLLAGLRRDFGLTVLLITHSATVAAASDRVLVLVDGQVARDGPTRDLVPHGAPPEHLAAALLGSTG